MKNKGLIFGAIIVGAVAIYFRFVQSKSGDIQATGEQNQTKQEEPINNNMPSQPTGAPAHTISESEVVQVQKLFAKNHFSLNGMQAYHFETDSVGAHVSFYVYMNDEKIGKKIVHFKPDGTFLNITDEVSL